jgi:hypothetical protein
MTHESGLHDFPAFPEILGTASYLAGDYPTAVTALEKAINQMTPDHPRTVKRAFFLAMAHARLQNAAEARKWYDQAVQGMAKHKPRNEELRRLREEAATVLGIQQEESHAKPPSRQE